MKFPKIEVAEKFALISFTSDKCWDLPLEGLQINKNLWLISRCPLALDDWWVEQFGKILCQEIANGKMFLLAKIRDVPTRKNETLYQLEKKLKSWHDGVLLRFTPRSHLRHMVVGINEGEGAKVWRYTEMEAVYTLTPHKYKELNCELIRNSQHLGQMQDKILKHKKKYARLKRGLHALHRSFREQEVESRFHDLVRAIEAVIYPEEGKTQRQFVHRCALLMKNSPANRDILEEMYKLRSAVDHMHSLYSPLNRWSGKRMKTCMERLEQLDFFARSIYVQLFSNPSLCKFFINDEATKKFWLKKDDEIKKLWPANITFPITGVDSLVGPRP